MTKLKLSVTLPPDLVVRIDREAARSPGGSRSAVIERWLREAARGEARRALDQATADYYEGLGVAERREDEEWSRYAAASFPGAGEASRAAEPPPRKTRR